MSTGKIISILLIVAGVIVLIVGVYEIYKEIDHTNKINERAGWAAYDPNIKFTNIIKLIIGVACIGTGIFIAVKEKKKS